MHRTNTQTSGTLMERRTEAERIHMDVEIFRMDDACVHFFDVCVCV